MAKFNLMNDLKGATKPLYAGVGATDLAVERVRDLITGAQERGQRRLAEAQDSVRGIDLEPSALRDQAVTRVNARVDALAQEAKDRRASIEKRVGELQSEALATVGGAYGDLVSRGEGLVTRIRRQESTQSTRASARTTATKAKTTKTQATKATSSTAKQTTGTARKTAAKKSAPARSSAKATTTAAKRTASDAAQAAGDAAAKVGD